MVCTILYIVVSGLLTHLVPYTQLNVPGPGRDWNARDGASVGDFFGGVRGAGGPGDSQLVMLLGQSQCSTPCRGMDCCGPGPAKFIRILNALCEFDRSGFFCGYPRYFDSVDVLDEDDQCGPC